MMTALLAVVVIGFILIVLELRKVHERLTQVLHQLHLHAKPAPALSAEEIEKRRRLRPALGHSVEAIESDIRREQIRRRRLSMAQYIAELRDKANYMSSEFNDWNHRAELEAEAKNLEQRARVT